MPARRFRVHDESEFFVCPDSIQRNVEDNDEHSGESPGFKCAPLDISQAFIQAEEVAIADQIIGIPPDCIRLEGNHWNGQMVINSKTLEVEEETMHSPGQNLDFLFDDELPEHQSVKTRMAVTSGHGPYGFLIRRPLYGSRHAPLRWWLKLSSVMKKG